MASKGATYQLKVLLSLQDRLSAGLDKSAGKLRSFGKLSASSLQSFGKLRRDLSRDVNATALDKALAKLRAFNKEAKASTKPVDVAGKVRAGRRRGAGAAEPSAKPPAEYSAKQAADTARVLRLEREKARLVTDQTRAAREQARLATDAASHSLRLQREESRLAQADARARQIAQRASSAAELSDLRLQRERIQLQRDADRRDTEQRRLRCGVLDRVDRFGGRADAVRYGFSDLRRGFDTLSEFAQPAFEQMRAEARFRVMGFAPQENTRGMAAVEETTRTVRGVKRSDVIETLTALTSTFGDVEQASKFLPIAAKYRANMATLYGDVYAPTDVNRQISNTFKALELLGVDRPTGAVDATGQRSFTEEDRARMERYFNTVAAATAATGGDINPAEFRAFAKYGRTAVMGLTPEGLQKLLPLVQQLGGSQTGTALMSLNQNLIGGAMPAYKLREWDRLGLLDRSKVEVTKAGLVKRMQPGAIPMAETLLTDPMQFADNLTDVLRGRGVDTTDFNAVNKQVMALLGNRTASGALSQMINYRASLGKEARNYERAQKVSDTYGMLFEGRNPLANILDVQTKWTDAQARQAKSMADAGGGAAGTAADWMARHPDAAAALTGVKALGAASAEAAGGVGSLASAIAGLRGGGAGAGGGGIYGTGAGVGDVVAGGWAGLKALKWVGRGAAGVAGSAVGAVVAPYAAAALSTAAGGIGIYIRHTAGVAGEAADRAAAETIESTRVLRAQAGGRLPDEVAKGLGAAAFAQLNRAGDLTTKVEPGLKGAYQRVYDPSPYSGWLSVYDQNRAAGVFKERAPALQYAEVMRPFIEDVTRRWRAGEISPEAKDRTLKTAATAFPEAYKQATATLQNDVAGLGTSIRSASEILTTGFNQMRDPAARIPPAFSSVADAASDMASRLGSISFQVPAAPPAAATGPTKQPGGPSLPWLNYGKSAAGSVIERDGLVYLHRGNVVTPAHLSRRAPGDWLDALSALKSFARDDSRTGGGVARPPAQFNPPQSAAGSVVQGDGLASVHKGNVITPARLSRRAPGDWMEDFRAVRDLRDSLTTADAGAARGPAAPVRLTSAGGAVINNFYVTVSVPAGSRAAEDPQELARLVGREVRALWSEVAEMRGALYNPDFIASRASLAWEMDSERQ